MAHATNTILIVDDTPENLRVLGELLESDGHAVSIASTGKQALDIVGAIPVDLILLDIMMPGMDGYEVCRQLKAKPETQDVPVIFLTALDSPDDEARGLALGAVDYITKPFKLELVRARVSNHLALQNARAELKKYSEHLESLVDERTRELAEAHRKLMTVDSAKYDFLQLIYQALWAPRMGIIELSRQAIGRLDPADAQNAALGADYEAAQAKLLETINNALLIAGRHAGPRPAKDSPVRLNTVIESACAKLQAVSRERDITLKTEAPGDPIVAFDLDLLFQSLATLLHATLLLARPGSAVALGVAEEAGATKLELRVGQLADPHQDYLDLFNPESSHHPSEPGRVLGLTIPLALKILASNGSRLYFTQAAGGAVVLVQLRPFERKGAKITL